MTSTPDVALDDIKKVLREQLRFQRRCQLLSMTFYVTSTVGTLLCTSAAGVVAAMHYDRFAIVLAASRRCLSASKEPAVQGEVEVPPDRAHES